MYISVVYVSIEKITIWISCTCMWCTNLICMVNILIRKSFDAMQNKTEKFNVVSHSYYEILANLDEMLCHSRSMKNLFFPFFYTDTHNHEMRSESNASHGAQ